MLRNRLRLYCPRRGLPRCAHPMIDDTCRPSRAALDDSADRAGSAPRRRLQREPSADRRRGHAHGPSQFALVISDGLIQLNSENSEIPLRIRRFC
jgi:hypothetical protein